MTSTTLYILHTIATAPGPMTVEGLMERLESALATRLLRVHLNELLQDQSIRTTEDPATRRPIITGLSPGGARSLAAIAHGRTPAVTVPRKPAVRAARRKGAQRAATLPGELLNKVASHLNTTPSTPRQIAGECDVTLEEAAAAVRVLHRRGRIRRHVDETRPSTGIARRWHNVSWIGRELAERQREALRQAERADPRQPDDHARLAAAIPADLPRLRTLANNPSHCR